MMIFNDLSYPTRNSKTLPRSYAAEGINYRWSFPQMDFYVKDTGFLNRES